MAHGKAKYKSTGPVATGASSLSVSYPSGIEKGDLIVLSLVYKWSSGTSTTNTPSGWNVMDEGNTHATGGGGTVGTPNQGPVGVDIYYRIATGSEAGSVAISWTSAVTSCQGVMMLLTKPYDTKWGLMHGLTGYRNSATSSGWGTTRDAGSELYLTTDDTLVTCVGVNTSTYNPYTAFNVRQTSLTMSLTNRVDEATTNGTRQRMLLHSSEIVSGVSDTDVWGYTMTSNGYSPTNTYPTGAVFIMVIRTEPYKILKRWTGTDWKRAVVKIRDIGNWPMSAANINKPLKMYDGQNWEQVAPLYLFPSTYVFNITAAAQQIIPTIYNGHQIYISTPDSWITFHGSVETLTHKNAFALTTIVAANSGSPRTGYIHILLDGTTYKTITVNQGGPFVKILNDCNHVEFNAQGNDTGPCGDVVVIQSSENWTSGFINDGYGTSWAHRSPEVGSNGQPCTISVDFNTSGTTRNCRLRFSISSAFVDVTITQSS